MRTPIIGRPRRLPAHRRADLYTLNCEEPVTQMLSGACRARRVVLSFSKLGFSLEPMSEWGWNPETFEAVGTTGAAGAAVIALWLSLRQSWRRRNVDRRAQANLVAAWSTVVDPPSDLVEPDDMSTPEEVDAWYRSIKCVMHVANRSDRPVTQILVTTVPVPSLGERPPQMTLLRSLGPGEVKTTELGITDRHDALGYPGRVLSLEFVDSVGVRWRRDDSSGSLTEVTTNGRRRILSRKAS